MSNSKIDSLIEKELLRKNLYENEFIEMSINELGITNKEVCHLLLRYQFNKIISKTEEDDPVFIVTKSPIAEEQLKKDFTYYKLKTDPNNFIEKLEYSYNVCSNIMKKNNIPSDKRVFLSSGKLIYNNLVFKDISNLARKNPRLIKYALSLNIRYNYLKLTNHGLARIYKNIASPSEGCEAFSSAFNHYFDHFCSSFPDLESPFGSMGSFFNNTVWPYPKVFVNPPFDESLMSCTMDRIVEYCKSDTKIEFLCTFPKWDGFSSLDKFKTCEWVKKINVYEKGKLPFIDYMNNNKIIYPCGIVEIIATNDNKIDIINIERDE